MNLNTINRKFNIGDKVQYTRGGLQSINANADIADLTGIVQSIKDIPQIKKTVVKVLWNDGELQSCLSCNIIQTDKTDITGF
jgi:hypothetical protein